MSARTKARKRAIDVLFAADVRQVQLQEILTQESERAAKEPQRASSWEYAREILLGVLEHETEIDAVITKHNTSWDVARMPAVDRAILRVACWELLHNPNVPTGVVIDEAVEAAKLLSTEDSGRFVNGLLSGVAKERE